jgi:multiple sugar transport system substrate-binding protein
MRKSILMLVALLIVFSMLLSACASATPTAAPEPTEVMEEPTEAMVESTEAVAEPTEAMVEPTEEVKEPVSLVFVNWIGAEDATKPAMDAMLAGFTEKYPWITVESQPFPFNQSKDQLIVMSTGGTPPDASMSHPTWVGPLQEAGVLEPLNDLIPSLDQWPATSLAGWTYDGNIMAVTWAPSPVTVYYNKNLLAQAGYNEPPQTWDEMLTMARDVAALGKDAQGNQIYGLGISSKKLAGAGYFSLPFFYAYGGQFVDDSGNIVLDSPENLEALQAMKTLFDEGVTPEGLEIRDLRNLFATGTMAFHWDIEAGIGIFAGLSEKGADFAEDYGVMLMPGQSADQPGKTILLEHNLVVYKDSPHKEEAAMLLDYLTSPEGIAIYNEYGGNKLPIRSDTAQIDYFKAAENQNLQVFIDQIAYAEALPAKSSAFLGAMEEIAGAIQRISLNNEDPAVVLPELDAAVKALYNQ